MFRSLVLALALVASASAFTRTPMSMATHKSISRYAGPPVKDIAAPQPSSSSISRYEGPPVKDQTQWGFRYGNGDNATPVPLGGSGAGPNSRSGMQMEQAHALSRARSEGYTRDSFQYGSRSVVRTPPTPLGGSGNGIARDFAQSQTQTKSAYMTRDSFKYGSRSTTRDLKPLGGINPF